MEWLTGLAPVPALICAGMMAGATALVALGRRRPTGNTNDPTSAGTQDSDRRAERAPERPGPAPSTAAPVWMRWRAIGAVVAGIAVLAVAAPDRVAAALPFLAVAVCPVTMLVMGRTVSRSNRDHAERAETP